MDRVGLRYQPADLEIRRPDRAAALGNLARYFEGRRDRWWTVINKRPITPAWIGASLATLTF